MVLYPSLRGDNFVSVRTTRVAIVRFNFDISHYAGIYPHEFIQQDACAIGQHKAHIVSGMQCFCCSCRLLTLRDRLRKCGIRRFELKEHSICGAILQTCLKFPKFWRSTVCMFQRFIASNHPNNCHSRSWLGYHCPFVHLCMGLFSLQCPTVTGCSKSSLPLLSSPLDLWWIVVQLHG